MPVRSRSSERIYHVAVAVNDADELTFWCDHNAQLHLGERRTVSAPHQPVACGCAERCAQVLAEYGWLTVDERVAPARSGNGKRHAWQLTTRGAFVVARARLADRSRQVRELERGREAAELAEAIADRRSAHSGA